MGHKQTHPLFSLVVFAAFVTAVTLTGCVVGPNADLQRARTSLVMVQQDSQVITYAPAQLHEAELTLNRAEQTWNATGDRIEVAHLSYIAEQQANLAVAKAQENAAEAEARRLADERDQVRLSMRAREAELANERAREATLRAQEATARAQEATTRARRVEGEFAGLPSQDTDCGLVMTLQDDVLFEYNRADLKPGARYQLYPLVTFLREHPDRTLIVEGYTDNLGLESYNLDLSRSRAAAVRDFLVLNGISPNRIIAYGYGEASPVASNATEAGRQLNRRVEIVISHAG